MSGAAVVPFAIEVGDEVIDDLHHRLDATRWFEPLPGAGWNEGIDLDYLRELCRRWRHEFDWRAVEARLNRFPQYTTEIDGQNIHFVHARSRNPEAQPLVIHHGWPGSFTEFAKVIDPLRQHFHVVCPSLPGYGFSGPTSDPGWTPKRMAAAALELMSRLGYERFGAQGGDWGSTVSSQMALQAPERLVGIHLNLLIVPEPPPGAVRDLNDEERAHRVDAGARNRVERGYREQQATRPQTLSVGLNDSPAGLAAWIVEKFKAWSDIGPDGSPDECFTTEDLLTNVMVYWVTGTIASANRLYYETRTGGRGAAAPDRRVEVPTAYARFPGDGIFPARPWAEYWYNIVRWTEMPRGGHFAALDAPDLFTADVVEFFSSLR
ncbi:epoxide hydrolase family protein [Candidatus Poriferisocius sp.]|uniref:epoxide hydrolase family protein n=1 Tax=Candidatus Poriferisocius sp. TaxID=3101276 RepID=UPI003B5D032A